MAADDALSGRILGETWVVERRLGEGGMGAVYAARNVRTGRPYAVKVLLPEASPTPRAFERFRREAEAVSALGHAGIVAVHDFHRTEDGIPYIVMDLLEGEDLAQRLEREGPLRWPDARRVFEQVASALAAAHAVGILHRDLKPANVFLSRRPGAPEQAVLLDFGLAKLADEGDAERLTATGTVMGTPSYMSPEQARGEPVDARTDVYSLGAVLFEMLAGAPPFTGPNSTAILARVLTEPPPVLSTRAAHAVPAGLDAVVTRALAKSPDERPPSVEALAAEVAAADGGAAHRPPPTRVREPVPPTRAVPVAARSSGVTPRSLVPLLAAAALLVLIVAGGAVVWIAPWEAGETAPRTPEAAAEPREPEPAVPETPPEPAPPKPAQVAEPDPAEPAQVAEPDPAEPDEAGGDAPDPEADETAEDRADRPAPRRRRASADRPEEPRAADPPADPPAGGPPAGGPPAGVREAVAHMERSDWRGCLQAARAAPPSPQTLQLQINCGLQLRDRPTVERACAEHRRRWPDHPFSASCQALAQTL